MFSDCLARGKIPSSWTEARIVVIPKQDKDAVLPQDYRPIFLLNSDYKILMTILACRLNGVMGSYIHPDQAGFIKRLINER